MEYITTVRYLERYMPAGNAMVADIGSDPGRYSRGLLNMATASWLSVLWRKA
jgi:hypothetical protein